MSFKVRCNTPGNLDYPPPHLPLLMGLVSWLPEFGDDSFWVFLLQQIPWYISVVSNSLLSRPFQIRWEAHTLSLTWSAWPGLKTWTLDLEQNLPDIVFIFLAKYGLLRTCPSSLAKHSSHDAEVKGKKIREVRHKKGLSACRSVKVISSYPPKWISSVIQPIKMLQAFSVYELGLILTLRTGWKCFSPISDTDVGIGS